MLTKSGKELAFGLIVLVFGAGYLALTTQLPRKGAIDSATVPYILSILMVTLGVIQTVLAVRMGRGEAARAKSLESELMDAAPADCDCAPAKPARPDYLTVAVTGLLITGYVILLDWLGFMVMSTLYLFLQISLLTPGYMKRSYAKYAVIAVVTPVVVYYLFFWAFDIMLPHGELWFDLGIDFEWSPFDS